MLTKRSIMEIDQGRQNLTTFVWGKAREMREQGNAAWMPSSTAPESYEALQAHFYDVWAVGGTIKVSAAHSENTVYLSPEANYASRFWHDCLHFLHRLDFSLDSEIRVGLIQVQAVANRFGARSTEAELMYMDTVAMSIYCYQYGQFPANQLEFILENMK